MALRTNADEEGGSADLHHRHCVGSARAPRRVVGPRGGERIGGGRRTSKVLNPSLLGQGVKAPHALSRGSGHQGNSDRDCTANRARAARASKTDSRLRSLPNFPNSYWSGGLSPVSSSQLASLLPPHGSFFFLLFAIKHGKEK